MPVKYRTETNKQAAYLFGPVIYEHEYKMGWVLEMYTMYLFYRQSTLSHMCKYTL